MVWGLPKHSNPWTFRRDRKVFVGPARQAKVFHSWSEPIAMNVSNDDIAELFQFFATMKGDIDLYRDTHTVQKAA